MQRKGSTGSQSSAAELRTLAGVAAGRAFALAAARSTSTASHACDAEFGGRMALSCRVEAVRRIASPSKSDLPRGSRGRSCKQPPRAGSHRHFKTQEPRAAADAQAEAHPGSATVGRLVRLPQAALTCCTWPDEPCLDCRKWEREQAVLAAQHKPSPKGGAVPAAAAAVASAAAAGTVSRHPTAGQRGEPLTSGAHASSGSDSSDEDGRASTLSWPSLLAIARNAPSGAGASSQPHPPHAQKLLRPGGLRGLSGAELASLAVAWAHEVAALAAQPQAFDEAPSSSGLPEQHGGAAADDSRRRSAGRGRGGSTGAARGTGWRGRRLGGSAAQLLLAGWAEGGVGGRDVWLQRLPPIAAERLVAVTDEVEARVSCGLGCAR